MRTAVFAFSLILMLPLPPFSRARSIEILRRLESVPRPLVNGQASLAVEEGTTLDAAVVVPVGSEDLLRNYENDWIFKYYGRFRRAGGGVGAKDGRHFEVVKVELGDHTERTFYFDITKAWGKTSSN
jgi:hypothetical protein